MAMLVRSPGASASTGQRSGPGAGKGDGAEHFFAQLIPDQRVDPVGLRDMNEGPPWVDAVIDPWSLPVGRTGEEFLRKLRCARCRKFFLDLQASAHAYIYIRLNKGKFLTDVPTRRASEIPESSGWRGRSSVQHGDVTRRNAEQLVSLLPVGEYLQFVLRHLEDHAVAGRTAIRKGSQIRGPPTDSVDPVVPATRDAFDRDREALTGFRPGLLSGFLLNQ